MQILDEFLASNPTYEDYESLPVRLRASISFYTLTYTVAFSRGQPRPNNVDATRISDGSRVYIKRVKTESPELLIAKFLSSDPSSFAGNTQNHCVPLLDHFADNVDSRISYIVMLFLRRFDDPLFETVADVIDFVNQIVDVRAHLSCDSRVHYNDLHSTRAYLSFAGRKWHIG